MLGSVAITLEQNQHKEKEVGLHQEKRVLKVEIKEMELAHQEMIKALKKVSTTTDQPQKCAVLDPIINAMITGARPDSDCNKGGV